MDLEVLAQAANGFAFQGTFQAIIDSKNYNACIVSDHM